MTLRRIAFLDVAAFAASFLFIALGHRISRGNP